MGPVRTPSGSDVLPIDRGLIGDPAGQAGGLLLPLSTPHEPHTCSKRRQRNILLKD